MEPSRWHPAHLVFSGRPYKICCLLRPVSSQSRQLVARFDGERLKALELPSDLPTEEDFVASINTFKPRKDAPKLELSEAERAALPRPAKVAQALVDAPQGAARNYPPLEK